MSNGEEKLQGEYEDVLFRLVMHKAAEREGELFIQEMEELKDNSEYAPTDEEKRD